MNGDEQRDPSYISKGEMRGNVRAVRPKDAATLLIVRHGGREPRVLMGKRAASHKFMPVTEIIVNANPIRPKNIFIASGPKWPKCMR